MERDFDHRLAAYNVSQPRLADDEIAQRHKEEVKRDHRRTRIERACLLGAIAAVTTIAVVGVSDTAQYFTSRLSSKTLICTGTQTVSYNGDKTLDRLKYENIHVPPHEGTVSIRDAETTFIRHHANGTETEFHNYGDIQRGDGVVMPTECHND
jgi:hypothetical protein